MKKLLIVWILWTIVRITSDMVFDFKYEYNPALDIWQPRSTIYTYERMVLFPTPFNKGDDSHEK